MTMKSSIQIIWDKKSNRFKLLDNIYNHLFDKRVTRKINLYHSYFEDFSNYIFKKDINHIELKRFIEELDNILEKRGYETVIISPQTQLFITENEYAINEQKIAGETIKSGDKRWDDSIKKFEKIINQEICRLLKPEQLRASFYLATMKKAANFSVPGAGKTAMMYGAFAYLSSHTQNKINKILVVCPINAFNSWKIEFKKVFGEKRSLNFMNLRDKKYENLGKLRYDWGTANIIVINFEALEKYKGILNDLIDSKTMLVIDEVHRIKGITSTRAKAALDLGHAAYYKYVLTGTPIPNTYQDIHNFLNFLYKYEYDSYFGWDTSYLKNPDSEEINEKIAPFFWRTNKKDLNVPKADKDIIIKVAPSEVQQHLSEVIYENEYGSLAKYIRLLQASTNPELLLKNINYKELGLLDEDVKNSKFAAFNKKEQELYKQNIYENLNLDQQTTPKFERGINLIEEIVMQRKKVLVWGLFVDTMKKIDNRLNKMGIDSILIYGKTPKEDRQQLLDEFEEGKAQVLVTNPNTLGESISLHHTVHDAVYFEYNFNLTFMLQSRDRIHRLGLKKDQYTRYYYLMTIGNKAHHGYVDEAVYDRLKEKEKIMLNAIDGEKLVPFIEDDYLTEVMKIIK